MSPDAANSPLWGEIIQGLEPLTLRVIMRLGEMELSQVALVLKNLPANAGDVRDTGLIPGWGRSPGEGNGNPLQYSCLENSLDRGAWWATVHGATQSLTRLSS